MINHSPLQLERLNTIPCLPPILDHVHLIKAVPSDDQLFQPIQSEISHLFPFSSRLKMVRFSDDLNSQAHPLRVGVVFSGGQAAGGHNVIWGLFTALKKIHPHSVLFGFCDGPIGIINQIYIEITSELLKPYCNQGGFDLIGSGRDKIETKDQLISAEKMMNLLHLDGLVIIGGDDSNTNAAILAEYFKQMSCQTAVIGVPKTIDGDLKNQYIEMSFGFDTATKTYSEIIGNLAKDALSAKKYYYFIKLMGRSASHITLECALQTHPNMVIISEEIQAKQVSLGQIINSICDLIIQRSHAGKNYGVILIPEGLIECIPDIKILIQELNAFSSELKQVDSILKKLSAHSATCFKLLPDEIQRQLLISRDPHGNLQVSKIESERLLIQLVEKELKHRNFSKPFSSQSYFCGYEGRCGLPSLFDCQYCYALGFTAAALIRSKLSGYMSCIKNLKDPVDQWIPCGIPLVSLLTIESRLGRLKPVIEKALVNLDGTPFIELEKHRSEWALNDHYLMKGPIQFFGPQRLTHSIPKTLELERSNNNS